MHRGFVKLYRSFDDSEAARFPPVTRELWHYLLRQVNGKDNGQYKRGQGFFNLGEVQDDLSWYVGYRKMGYSKPQLTKSLRRLCEAQMIATAKATRGVIITILNYEKFQSIEESEGNDEGKAKETRRKSLGHTKNKKLKEGKKERINNKPNGRFVPPTIEEVKAYVEEKDLVIKPATFIDHYTSNGWKVGQNPMKDWRAAARNWHNKQKDRQKGLWDD